MVPSLFLGGLLFFSLLSAGEQTPEWWMQKADQGDFRSFFYGMGKSSDPAEATDRAYAQLTENTLPYLHALLKEHLDTLRRQAGKNLNSTHLQLDDNQLTDVLYNAPYQASMFVNMVANTHRNGETVMYLQGIINPEIVFHLFKSIAGSEPANLQVAQQTAIYQRLSDEKDAFVDRVTQKINQKNKIKNEKLLDLLDQELKK